jgi:hypothetical protein
MPTGVYVRTTEARANIGAAQRGRKQSPETIAKRVAKLRGRAYQVRAHLRHDDVRCRAAHRRIFVERGKADAHTCVDCDAQAMDWSLSWRRVDPEMLKYDPDGADAGRPYTLNVMDYDPRCRSHAQSYDLDFNRKAA